MTKVFTSDQDGGEFLRRISNTTFCGEISQVNNLKHYRTTVKRCFHLKFVSQANSAHSSMSPLSFLSETEHHVTRCWLVVGGVLLCLPSPIFLVWGFRRVDASQGPVSIGVWFRGLTHLCVNKKSVAGGLSTDELQFFSVEIITSGIRWNWWRNFL